MGLQLLYWGTESLGICAQNIAVSSSWPGGGRGVGCVRDGGREEVKEIKEELESSKVQEVGRPEGSCLWCL